MSEENNGLFSSPEKDENLKIENRLENEDDDSKTALQSDESLPTENVDVLAEQELPQPIQPKKHSIPSLDSEESNVEAAEDSSDEHDPQQIPPIHSQNANRPVFESVEVAEDSQDNPQQIPPTQSENRNEPVLESEKRNVEVAEDSSSEQLSKSDPPIKTKTLKRTSDDQPAATSTSSDDISPFMAPSSDKALSEVAENFQLIYKGIKEMSLNTRENPGSASGKKGRKPASTPRAKSTPVTSPPLTRSRSRDLRKFPSTPSSPKRITSRKDSESDTDEIKGARGRQRVKKN